MAEQIAAQIGDNALANNSLTVWVEGLQSDLTELIGRVPPWLWVPVLAAPIAVAGAFALRDRPAERELEESSV